MWRCPEGIIPSGGVQGRSPAVLLVPTTKQKPGRDGIAAGLIFCNKYTNPNN